MRTFVCCLTGWIAVPLLFHPLDAGEIQVWGTLAGNEPAGNDFVDVDGGMLHGLGLRSDGSLVNFGNSAYWGHSTPGGVGYQDIACGFHWDVAIQADGSLIAWGNNDEGQLNVPAGNDFVSVAASLYFGLALRSNGTLAAWGNNSYGQLNVPGGTYQDIATGGYHGIALDTNGIVSCWGKSNEGALGAAGWAASDIAGYREGTYIVTTGGTLRGFGQNFEGEGRPPSGGGFVQVAGDYMHGYGLRDDGTIAGWGMNYYGAVNTPAGDDFYFIAAGERTGYALRFQPGSLALGSGTITADGDGFSAGGFSVQGLGGAVPLPFTVTVEDLVLEAGMATLLVEYDPLIVAQEGITESSLRLNWWDEGHGQWVLAGRSGNNDNTSGQFVLGSPTTTLGDWGVDTVADSVWANIDHASTYSVAGNVVPEPASIALLWLAALLSMILRKHRRFCVRFESKNISTVQGQAA